jgi:hypothetical protein
MLVPRDLPPLNRIVVPDFGPEIIHCAYTTSELPCQRGDSETAQTGVLTVWEALSTCRKGSGCK